MNATDIIRLVEQQGAKIKLHGDVLEVVNGQSLPPETVNLLKQHKPDLLAHLAAGGAQIIEPLEHANDEPTPWERLKQRAIGAYEYQLRQATSSLIKNGYNVDNAMVRKSDWQDSIKRVMHLSNEQVERIERELIEDGLLSYACGRIYLTLGNGSRTATTHSENPDFILDDDTGRTFINWLYS